MFAASCRYLECSVVVFKSYLWGWICTSATLAPVFAVGSVVKTFVNTGVLQVHLGPVFAESCGYLERNRNIHMYWNCTSATLAPATCFQFSVQELCESRGGRPGLPVLTSIMVSVDVKQH